MIARRTLQRNHGRLKQPEKYLPSFLLHQVADVNSSATLHIMFCELENDLHSID